MHDDFVSGQTVEMPREVYVATERQVLVARESQQFQLLTIYGVASYACPPEVRHIDELYVDDFHRYLLRHVLPADFARAILGVQARPVYFSFYEQRLHLYPIPDREYRIGFTQIDRGLNYEELSRITRYAFAPRMARDVIQQTNEQIAAQYQGYGGGFTVTNDAYYAAREKSLALLQSWLSPEQLDEFKKTNSFEVTGSRSKKRYRILQSTAYNVSLLGESNKLCFVPEGVDSVGDIMLAQKIMLENDEDRALKVANVQNT